MVFPFQNSEYAVTKDDTSRLSEQTGVSLPPPATLSEGKLTRLGVGTPQPLPDDPNKVLRRDGSVVHAPNVPRIPTARLTENESGTPSIKTTKHSSSDPRVKHAGAIAKSQAIIAQNLTALTRAAIDVGLGHKQIQYDKKTGEQIGVYDTPPDAKTIFGLMDRVMGKPTEVKEVQQETTQKHQVHLFLPDNGRRRVVEATSTPNPNNGMDHVPAESGVLASTHALASTYALTRLKETETINDTEDAVDTDYSEFLTDDELLPESAADIANSYNVGYDGGYDD